MNKEEFYASLKEKLEAAHDFPENYLFKFIIPNDQSKLTEIYRVFDGLKYTLSNRDSKNGKYVSVNVNAFVLDADQVIKIYQEVAKVEKVLML
ncbi:MAG: DUF493 domain-containing protein [Flavobacteriaceae bacterium]|jgi:putative lipoic acid-binding regulatory protein|nr:DUF493 domain-containing protein [Flavobacteriaceae bacterium]